MVYNVQLKLAAPVVVGLGRGQRQAQNNGPVAHCTGRRRRKPHIEPCHTWLCANVVLQNCDERVESTVQMFKKCEKIVSKFVQLLFLGRKTRLDKCSRVSVSITSEAELA